ncbi:hypothetical protein MLD38_028157 [Melastoma candidum]|uniref:Uncharacterized protein n=1 Tax=Melastoma candidum TaxID=119954 RepID=A0ACB9N093_9MYRT|nr:hypothetical protein MLD38_028157 [Melastoma candidum]
MAKPTGISYFSSKLQKLNKPLAPESKRASPPPLRSRRDHARMMIGSSSAVCRLCFFLPLAASLLVFPCMLIPYTQSLVKHVDEQAHCGSDIVLTLVRSEIEHVAATLPPLNLTDVGLSRELESSFTAANLSFVDIYEKVAPVLFQTLLVAPYTSEISYIGLSGQFFSCGFRDEGSRLAVAVYANSSFGSGYTWYEQPANPHLGELLGEATQVPPGKINSAWFQEVINSTSVNPIIQAGWSHGQDLVLVNGVGINRKGVVSASISVKRLTYSFSSMNLAGGSLYLVTEEGEVLLVGIEGGHFDVSADSFTIWEEDRSRNYSCT